jgi:hypothetical protein
VAASRAAAFIGARREAEHAFYAHCNTHDSYDR